MSSNLKIFLKSFFVLYVFLISSSAFSSNCQDEFSTVPIFVQFAQKHMGEIWEVKMGDQWRKNISNATRYWTKKDAEHFLNFLQNRIGIEYTIKTIQYPFYFEGMDYQKFKKQISLYESYIGESGVTDNLRNIFENYNHPITEFFTVNNVNNTKLVLDYLGNRYGKEVVKKLIKKDLVPLHNLDLLRLTPTMEYMDTYIGKEATVELMEQNIEAFIYANVSNLKPVVEYMENYTGEEVTKEQMKQNFMNFTQVNYLSRLKQTVQYVQSHIGKKATIKQIKLDFRSFTISDTLQLNSVIKYVKAREGKTVKKPLLDFVYDDSKF